MMWDIGIFNRMENRNLIIKRIIRLPNDTIEIRQWSLQKWRIVGRTIPCGRVCYHTEEIYKVPEDHVFVLGDNRKTVWTTVYRIYTADNIKGTMALDISKLMR